jgi:hypothetical protein
MTEHCQKMAELSTVAKMTKFTVLKIIDKITK